MSVEFHAWVSLATSYIRLSFPGLVQVSEELLLFIFILEIVHQLLSVSASLHEVTLLEASESLDYSLVPLVKEIDQDIDQHQNNQGKTGFIEFSALVLTRLFLENEFQGILRFMLHVQHLVQDCIG